jgi:outer membrane receptor protein involved in Fe transport
MKILSIIISLLLTLNISELYAQKPELDNIKTVIKGNIIDSASRKPLEFAAISVYKEDSLISGAISDADGDFTINLSLGKYRLKIDFIGYNSKIIDNIKFTPELPFVNLGRIMLTEDQKMQTEVIIKGEKSLMQLGLDKRVFNVEKSALSDAENATEVLRATPGVEVDKDEAVKVRGKSVTVFINGKPTGLSGENQAAILRQIPANTIKSIEIMTNPSARNAPDGGSSTIINIVLKKNTLEGFTGSVNAGIGTNALAFNSNPEGYWFNKYNGGLALNYKSRNINLFSNINLNERGTFSSAESFRQNFLPDSSYYFNTYSDSRSVYKSLWGRIGADFYLNETNTLSIQVNGNPSTSSSKRYLTYDNFDSDSILSGFDTRSGINENRNNSMTYNVIYSVIFPEKDSTGHPNLDKIGSMGENRELVFDLQLTDSRAVNPNELANYYFDKFGNTISTLPDSQFIRTLSNNYQFTGKIDYTHPISRKNQKIQLGYHFTQKKDNNDFRYENFNSASLQMENDSSRSNIFEYTQLINAVYGTFSHKIGKKWAAEYGLRLEYAHVNPFLVNTATSYPWSYFGIFPTLNFAYDLSETQQLSFNLGRTVSRPWIWEVNPFPNFNDPRFLDFGNPYLRPSFNNNFSVNYALFVGGQSINISYYSSISTGESIDITSINPVNAVLSSAPENLGNSFSNGLDINANFNLSKWWSINSSFNAYHNYNNADIIDQKLSYSTFGGGGSMYSNMRFKFGLSANIGFHSWYVARDIQGRTLPNVWHWASLTQSLLKNKLKITLSANNPFFINRWRVFTDTPFSQGFAVSLWENRVVNLRLSYNFGKTKVKKQRTSRLEGRTGSDSGGGNQGGQGK